MFLKKILNQKITSNSNKKKSKVVKSITFLSACNGEQSSINGNNQVTWQYLKYNTCVNVQSYCPPLGKLQSILNMILFLREKICSLPPT